MGGDGWNLRPGESIPLREAEGGDWPFLMYEDRAKKLVIHPLREGRVVIGRGSECDVVIDWDDRVSRAHATLERVGGEWLLEDDGLSRNGTFVNGDRVSARRRLSDWDVIQAGHTRLRYRVPTAQVGEATQGPAAEDAPAQPSPSQRRVLAALCRPCLNGGGVVAPATNEQIADELCLSVEAVKAHLREMYRRFGIEDLPQNQKRRRLVELAMQQGLARDAGA